MKYLESYTLRKNFWNQKNKFENKLSWEKSIRPSPYILNKGERSEFYILRILTYKLCHTLILHVIYPKKVLKWPWDYFFKKIQNFTLIFEFRGILGTPTLNLLDAPWKGLVTVFLPMYSWPWHGAEMISWNTLSSYTVSEKLKLIQWAERISISVRAAAFFSKLTWKCSFGAKTWPVIEKFEIFCLLILDYLITSLHSKFEKDSSRNGEHIKIFVLKSSFEKIAKSLERGFSLDFKPKWTIDVGQKYFYM